MFCKHCGKEISEDAKFCQFCGGSLVDETIKTVEQELNVAIKNVADEPFKIEVSKEKRDYSDVIANEITGNVKMIGLAICLFLAYMAFFYIANLKHIDTYDKNSMQSYYGASKYDGKLMGKYTLNWEEHYFYNLKRKWEWECEFRGYGSWYNMHDNLVRHESFDREQYLNQASVYEERLELTEAEIEKEKNFAKQEAEKEIKRWNNDINHYRKIGFESDLEDHAKYAAIISLILTIVGRYLVKLFKWTSNNSTN